MDQIRPIRHALHSVNIDVMFPLWFGGRAIAESRTDRDEGFEEADCLDRCGGRVDENEEAESQGLEEGQPLPWNKYPAFGATIVYPIPDIHTLLTAGLLGVFCPNYSHSN